jgi:hypothetical protein
MPSLSSRRKTQKLGSGSLSKHYSNYGIALGKMDMENPVVASSVEEQKQGSPDDIFYHYTTIEGLLGIVSTGGIWATHARFLNDTSEFKAGIEILSELMKDEPDLDFSDSEVLDRFTTFAKQLALPAFVTSFSAEPTGDDLSQWRAYGGAQAAFSIGFRREHLNAIGLNFMGPGANGWVKRSFDPFVECKYLDEGNKSEAKWLAKYFLGAFTKKGQRNMDKQSAALILARQSAKLKHKSFQAEKEWRIVLIRESSYPFDELQFRRSNSMLIPYIRLPLSWPGRPFKIARIVVGPTPHRTEAKESVVMLLTRYGVECDEVAETTIPFRNW